jgi:hypothetical protein
LNISPTQNHFIQLLQVESLDHGSILDLLLSPYFQPSSSSSSSSASSSSSPTSHSNDKGKLDHRVDKFSLPPGFDMLLGDVSGVLIFLCMQHIIFMLSIVSSTVMLYLYPIGLHHDMFPLNQVARKRLVWSSKC